MPTFLHLRRLMKLINTIPRVGASQPGHGVPSFLDVKDFRQLAAKPRCSVFGLKTAHAFLDQIWMILIDELIYNELILCR